MAHALDTILRAAEGLKSNPAARDVHFLFLGDGAEKASLKARAAERGLDNVTFLDSVPRTEVVRYWSLLDLAIIHLKRTPLFETVIPSKLFECMAMGLPILHGVAGESARIVTREQCGVLFQPENPDELADRILELAADPIRRQQLSARGSEAAARYDRSALAAEMLQTLLDVSEAYAVTDSRGRGVAHHP
jgi:glycosyltransferase involved in cell wall biosynthesis